MRICFVSSNSVWGGGEQVLATLIEEIRHAEPDVALVARRNSPLASWGREQRLSSVYEQPGRGRGPASLWRLRRWLVKNRFDVVVLNDPHAISSGGLAALGLPAVRIGVRHTVFPVRSAWKHTCLLDHIICVSLAAQAGCVAAGIPRNKTSVVYGGVPQPRVEPAAAAQIKELFQSVAASPEERHILAVGSLIYIKGFDTLIRAVAQGVGKGRPWRLWLAGEGPERPVLQSLAEELGVADRVHLLGFRQDIAELLAAADLFVSASHSEGLSLVIIEAMLAGCAVAATAVGGSCEVLQADISGSSPFATTFVPGNAAQLVDALQNGLAQSLENRQRSAGARRWARENFSADQMARKHLAVYERALARKKGPGPTKQQLSDAA